MTLGAIVYLWFVITLLGVIAFPLVFAAAGRLRDRGYSISKVISLVLITYVSWLLSSLKISPFGAASVGLGAALVFVASAFFAWRNRRELFSFLKENRRLLLGLELFFFAAFVVFLLIVSLNPDINPDSERFMDYALLNGIDRTDFFPPTDPWLSGRTMNYYYYGYIMMAALHKLAAIPLPLFFNLALALVYALFTLTCFGMGLNLTGKVAYGWLAAFALMFIGNLDGAIQIFGGKWNSFDFFHGARVLVQEAADGKILDYPINEFPFFSLMWGDLHAYVIAYPVNLAILNLVLNLALSAGRGVRALGEKLPERIAAGAVLVIAVGALFGTNTWDFPIYLAVLVVVLGLLHLKSEGTVALKLLDFLPLAAILAALSFFLYAPFNLPFIKEQAAQGRGGIGLVSLRSPIGLFLAAFGVYLVFPAGYLLARCRGLGEGKKIFQGPFLLFLIAALVVVAASGPKALIGETYIFLIVFFLLLALVLFSPGREPAEVFSLILSLSALSLAAVCEFFFLRDHYQGSGYERMNTVFKIYIHVWLFLGVAAVYFISYLNRLLQDRDGLRLLGKTVTAAALIAGFFYTLGALGARSRGRPKPLTLDGTAYIQKPVPSYQKEEWSWDLDDWEAINWMIANIPGRPVVLEATDNAYHWASRVSTFTGFPTLVGWVNHESGWRNSWKEPQERDKDTKTLYTTADANLALYLIRKYGIEYVYIGKLERNRFPKEGLDKFARMGQTVYHEGPVEIIRVAKPL
jgi:YYY domain-containing protein